MKLVGSIQEAVLTLLCYSTTAGDPQAIIGLLPLQDYDPFYKEVAAEVYDYISKYSRVPAEHTLDLFEQLKLRHPDSAEIYQRMYSSVVQSAGSINREYIFDNITKFARFQSIRRGIQLAIEDLERDDVDAADSNIRKSLERSVQLFDPGIRIWNPLEALRFLDAEDEYQVLYTGIPELDSNGATPARKQLALLAAGTGRGKSWWLNHLMKQAVIRRWCAVYVTLEMSEDEVAKRLIQGLFSVGKKAAEAKHQVFRKDEFGRFLDFDEAVIADREHLKKPGIRGVLTKKIEGLKPRRPVVIKQFPTGMLTIQELEGYLGSLEAAGVIPDILLVDYPDLMAVDSKNLRTDLGRITTQLRGIAVKRNIAVAAVTQLGAEGAGKRVATEYDSAENKGKSHTADVFITYNQTDQERSLGMARLYAAKVRGDRSAFSVLISQAYALGQFCMDSVMMAGNYWPKLDEVTNDGGQQDSDSRVAGPSTS